MRPTGLLHAWHQQEGLARIPFVSISVQLLFYLSITDAHMGYRYISHMRREAKSKRVLKNLRDVTMRAAARKDSPLPLLSNRNDIRHDNVPALNGLISHYFQDKVITTALFFFFLFFLWKLY